MLRSEISSIYQRRPELARFQAEIGEPTRIGNALTIVGHPFAQPVSNQNLLHMAIKFGLPESKIEAAKKAIDDTGFTNRYFSHLPEEEPNFESAIERTTDIGAILLRKTMAAQGWDGVDVFIGTSAFLPPSINKSVLEKAGLDPDRVTSRSYRYACAGMVAALIDTVSNPDMRDARVIIGALEPLSLFVNQSQFLSPEGLAFPSIFGDANTFLALNPSHFNLETKRILIKPDGGVIKLKTLYDFEGQPSEPNLIPSYYYYADKGEEFLRYSRSGAFLKILPPEAGSAVSMDGIRTGMFFGNNTKDVIVELLEENGNIDLLKQLNGKNVILHPASAPVVNRIAKLLTRGETKYLNSPNLPFLMEKAGYSNGSSATTVNRLRYMIENDMIDTRLPVFLIAPGIGSAIAGAIGKIHP